MKKVSLIFGVIYMLLIVLYACGNSDTAKSNSESNQNSSFSTKTINEVKIGNQVWIAENLNVDKFRNGDPIPQAKTKEEWIAAGKNKQPAWCYYDNDPANGDKYGKLYNWYAVNDSRGLAPQGCHISSDTEWTKLTDFLKGENDFAKKMKSTSGWKENCNGSNISGFSGLPGGNRYDDGSFHDVGFRGCFWSSTEANTFYSWQYDLYCKNEDVYRSIGNKECGYSVRCLMD